MFRARVEKEAVEKRRRGWMWRGWPCVCVPVCLPVVYTYACTRKRRERSSGGARDFSKEIFPGSHFPGELARPDSAASLVFRPGFIACEIRFREGQTATGSCRLRTHVRYESINVRIQARFMYETFRHFSLFFSRQKGTHRSVKRLTRDDSKRDPYDREIEICNNTILSRFLRSHAERNEREETRILPPWIFTIDY